MDLTWDIEGTKELSRRIGEIGKEIQDWTPAFKQAASDLKQVYENDVFSTEGSEVGEHWKPLSSRYLARKVAQGYPPDILIRTGKMKKSFQSLFRSDYAEVWNSVYYFKYHQSKEPRTRLPRRVMMKLGEQQKQLVVKIFHTYWHNKLTKG